MNKETANKTKKTSISFATLTVVLLLSAVLVVPSLAYADSDHGKTNSRDNDKSHEKDRKDKDDNNNKGTDCNSEKYDKQCDDIAQDKRDVAHDQKEVDKITADLAKDILHHEKTTSDLKALAKATADLAKDSADLADDLKSV
ncbi:MAG TPA: hypothetical protein VEU72_09330 [Nitrosopumilaceae archaeon]|nr:hypothetical protein [Nitrosopumilaceae archaeon]